KPGLTEKPRTSDAYGLSTPNAPLNSSLLVAITFSCDHPPTEFKARTCPCELGLPLNSTLRPTAPPNPPIARPRYNSPVRLTRRASGTLQSVMAAQPSTF